MTDAPHPAPGQAPSLVSRLLADGGSSNLADGEWHRLHPLTPLFKGGLVFVIVLGILIANMRDRVMFWVIRLFAPGELEDDDFDYDGDPITWGIDWVVANNMFLLVGVGLVVIVALICLMYWLVWRVHQFRITGENVEVRKGIVFRTHRRAPLDRIQGINLTRPFPARLIGMGKLTLEGAGTGADVALEFLGTTTAEQVRADILRLASGVKQAKQAARAPQAGGVVDQVMRNATHIVDGVDTADLVPESVVRIPVGRLLGSQLLQGLIWIGIILIVIAAIMVPSVIFADSEDRWIVLIATSFGTVVPMLFASAAMIWSALQKGFRYSIAPTPDGVRISSGLLTTVTRTIPPGRVHAVEVSQSLLWRPFGWWTVKINRMSGQSETQQSSSQAMAQSVVLPVGTRADVERVVGLLLPDAPARDALFTWEHGILGPQPQDPFTTVARRARLWHPIQWRRMGMRVTAYALLVRRGRLGRSLGIFPLARLQGVSMRQGLFARAQDVAALKPHTVSGPVSGTVSGLDRADAQRLADLVSRGAVAAAEADHSHRWATPA